MRKLLLLIALYIAHFSFGQNYLPFNQNNPKRFVNPLNSADNDFFFYPIETFVSGDTTTYRQYLRQSVEVVDVSGTQCEGWGGMIQPTADTTWLGRRFSYNNLTEELTLFNALSNSLLFDFGINLGDSSEFYQSANEHYFIRYDALNQELILDSLDWVKLFSVWKFDDLNNPLTSSLNGFEIKLGENLGLVSFIDCNNFPSAELGLQLMGQLNPTIGYYQMTCDEIFPWVPGDTLEVRGHHTNGEFQPYTLSHKLITIQNRVETSDSVWIFLNIDEQVNHYPEGLPLSSYPDTFNISYSNPIVFRKGDNIIAQPHNMKSLFVNTYFNDSIDHCGIRGRTGFSGQFELYCDSCDCFIPYDGFGSSVISEEYLEGLGLSQIVVQEYGPFPGPNGAMLIYSNVGGEQCGTYAALGIEELELNKNVHLVKIVDSIGRETEDKANELLFYIYSNGIAEKVFMDRGGIKGRQADGLTDLITSI